MLFCKCLPIEAFHILHTSALVLRFLLLSGFLLIGHFDRLDSYSGSSTAPAGGADVHSPPFCYSEDLWRMTFIKTAVSGWTPNQTKTEFLRSHITITVQNLLSWNKIFWSSYSDCHTTVRGLGMVSVTFRTSKLIECVSLTACGEGDACVWTAWVVKQAENRKNCCGNADFTTGLNRHATFFCKNWGKKIINSR